MQDTYAYSARSEAGASLIEIMIVVTIMAAIMGVAGYYLIGASDRSNIGLAESELGTLKGAVEQYYTLFNGYPESLNDLADPPNGPPIMEEIPNDPWGNEYKYDKGSDAVVLSSAGPDGSHGNDDQQGNHQRKRVVSHLSLLSSGFRPRRARRSIADGNPVGGREALPAKRPKSATPREQELIRSP